MWPTRALSLSFASDVDPHKTRACPAPRRPERWLAAVSWEQPPELKGESSLVLPAWTNRQPDWRAEVQPTLRLQGEFKLEHGGAYRGRRRSPPPNRTSRIPTWSGACRTWRSRGPKAARCGA